MALFESVGTVSYSPSTVTMAVTLAISEIFSVKEWPHLKSAEHGIRQKIKRQKVKRQNSKGRKSKGRKSNRQKIDRQKIERQKLLLRPLAANDNAGCGIRIFRPMSYMWVWGRSMSLKMAPSDRPRTTFYWSAIVTIALSCTIFELFHVE